MRTRIERIAQSIISNCDAMQVEVERNDSASTHSVYLTVAECITVRISDHGQKPWNGAADILIDPTAEAHGNTAGAALRIICLRLGLPVPKAIRAAEKRREGLREKRRKAEKASWAQKALELRAQEAQLAAQGSHYDSKRRTRLRQYAQNAERWSK